MEERMDGLLTDEELAVLMEDLPRILAELNREAINAGAANE